MELPQQTVCVRQLLFWIIVNTNQVFHGIGSITLWNMFPSGIKSVENIATFTIIPLQRCLSTISPWCINQSDDSSNFGIDEPLSLVSKDLGTIEIT